MHQCEYRRPQLVRDQWQALNSSWQFAFDDAARYVQPQDLADWPLQIVVPFAPEALTGTTTAFGIWRATQPSAERACCRRPVPTACAGHRH